MDFVTLPHEGIPHGVPSSYDWYSEPKVIGHTPPEGWTAALPWGQVYVDNTAATTAPNTRVEIGRVEMRILDTTDNHWRVERWCSVTGSWYPEDFVGASEPSDIRTEPSGRVSATAGDGKTFHFFPSARFTIDPETIGGVIVTVWARLIVADPDQPDDRSSARYLLSVGSDWYPDLVTPPNSPQPGTGIGRFRYVSSEWRPFHFTTMTEEQLNANPPN